MAIHQPLIDASPAVIRSVFRVLLTGVVIGIIGAFLAVGFVEFIAAGWAYLSALSWPGGGAGINLVLLLIPVLGGLIVGQLVRLSSLGYPFGVTDLVYRLQTRQDKLSPKDGLLTFLAALTGMTTGASVGIYGALTVIGASLGSNVARLLRWDLTLGIGCGVAAAISTAFNAPIAALVFVHEVILRHYSLRAFAPVAVASSTGFFVANYLLERPPLFQVAAERSFFAPEFLGFVVIGLVSAVVAMVFMHGILFTTRVAERTRLPAWIQPAVAGLGIGLLAQWVPEALSVGTQLLGQATTEGHFSASQLGLLLVAKIAATSLCLGFGYVGGVFSPSLVIGVLAGALLGELEMQIFGELSSDFAVYAVCGMMAVTSPVIGAPLTAILIVFELTRNYELTTAVMISVVFSNVVTYRLFGRSLFDLQLRQRGIDLSQGRDKVNLQRTSIAIYVDTEAVVLQTDQTVGDALDAMQEADRQEGVVLDEWSRYIGKLRANRLIELGRSGGNMERKLESCADPDALTLDHDMSVLQALEKLKDFVGESVPIVDNSGYFIGVVYESALVTAYLNTMESLRAEEHASS